LREQYERGGKEGGDLSHGNRKAGRRSKAGRVPGVGKKGKGKEKVPPGYLGRKENRNHQFRSFQRRAEGGKGERGKGGMGTD